MIEVSAWRMRSAFLSAALVAFGSLGAAAQSTAPSAPSSPSWVGTWATAAMRDGSAASVSDLTLRQIVFTSVAGSSARIHLSNLFGTAPLRIEDVHIAQQGDRASILPATDRKVLFGGNNFVMIAPGQEAVSDPVAFSVPARTALAISFYLPGPALRGTFHASAHQTSYVATGDLSGSADLPQAKPIRSTYVLTNLDVQGTALLGSVVAFGASITEGYNSTPNANHRWPDFLAQRLLDAGIAIGVLNEGISGNRLLVDGAGESAEKRFDRDVLAQPGVRWVIFSDDPINDLGSTKPPPTAAELIAGLQQLISRAHAGHIQFFCATLTPYEGANYWTPEGEAAREQINDFIRGGHNGCDGIVDEDTATHDPAHPTRYLPAYDSGDHLHPNDDGLKALAGAVDLALFSAAAPANKAAGEPK
jgi:lysophospholipase L1-like esterase